MKYCKKCGVELTIYNSYLSSSRHILCKTHYKEKRYKRMLEGYEKGNTKQQLREAANRSRLKHPEKWEAGKLLRLAVKRGEVIKKPCERCNTELKVHAHHEDYTKPLEVMWLCVKHHFERHAELKRLGIKL